MLRRVVVVGVGLIGGSFALALKRRVAGIEVIGMGRSRSSLESAQALGLIDRIASDAREALARCDLLLLAAPVAQTGPILAALAPHLGADTVVSDAGSTKGSVIDAARQALGARISQFVPGHPIAGSEASGPEAASAELYQGRKVVLTPIPENSPKSIETVAWAWRECGAQIVMLDPAAHDRALAAVSHLPHVLAYALVAHVAGAPDGAEQLELAGSGFRDATRIAASNPELWRDIVLSNRDALLAELANYTSLLERIRLQLESRDAAALEALFAAAQAARVALTRPGTGGSPRER